MTCDHDRIVAYILTSGTACAPGKTSAFDGALRDAKIADFNLCQVSSITSKGVPVYRMRPDAEPISGDGALMHAVYALARSQDPTEVLGACVGVGVTPARAGVIFFAEGAGRTGAECEDEVRTDIEWGMDELRHAGPYRFLAAPVTSADGSNGKWHGAMSALCFACQHLWDEHFRDVTDPA